MSNVTGQSYALSVLTPVSGGREGVLREEISGLPQGSESPFARLAGTHFARWVLVEGISYAGARASGQGTAHLLFSSQFDGGHLDGALDRHLADLRASLPEEADAVWGHCTGYPGSREAGPFSRYLKAHQVSTGFSVMPYPEATLEDVRSSLALRERLGRFAVDVQGLDPDALHEAFGSLLASLHDG